MIRKLFVYVLAIVTVLCVSTMFIKIKDLVEKEAMLNEYINSMSLEEKIGQLFIVTPEQVNESIPVGGIVFFANNIESREQISQYIQQAQEQSEIGLFMAVDEEGGSVARIGNNPNMFTTSFPPMITIQDDQQAYSVGNTIGREIKELGFNLDFAPVADVNSNPENPIIGERAFSNDPNEAAHLVEACVKGFQDAQMMCTLKHFPGHGDTNTDTHMEQTILGKSVEQLESCEWIPFKEAGNADFVMVSHIIVPSLCENGYPSSMSYNMITTQLKEHLGYKGLIVSDSFQMGAITNYFSSKDAAIQAILAGEDIILMPQNLEEAYYGLMEAVQEGTISQTHINEVVYRILQKKVEVGLLKLEN